MGGVVMREDAYVDQLQSLLPQGRAWPRQSDAVLTSMLYVIASELVNTESRANLLIEESDPRTTFDMLVDWEDMAGLPDNCSEAANTLEERYAALLQKLTNTGGQSIAFFQAVAESLGYVDIEIEEFRPFLAGVNRCGDLLGGGHEVRYYWRVRVPDARLTYFRAGLGRAGDTLMKISKAVDLECIFNRLKPAHTELIFSYEGV